MTFVTVPAFANRSPFEIEIEMSQEVYRVGDLIKGEIMIDNTYPATLPATFEMKMYHNGKLKRQSQVYVKTFLPGEMNIAFRTFRIPEKVLSDQDIGEWRIVINQVNADQEYAGTAEFEVVRKED